jgi:uracil phosphoribosyltransferase
MGNLHVMDHPLISHKLTMMRNKTTGVKEFRELAEEIAMLICFEATRNLPISTIQVETPIEVNSFPTLENTKFVIVPILRAGFGMTGAMLNLLPTAKTGVIGMYRDENSLKPVEYYCKLPVDIAESHVFVIDPMLATGGTATAAVSILKERGCKNIKFICFISAPEGVDRLSADHPDGDIYTGALDSRLNEHCYIVPGLGDAGDRLFGTK